jgi:hypothetical protein
LFDCTDFQDENARASRASTEELLCTLPLLAKTPAAINDVRLELMYYVNHHLSKKSFLKKLHQLQNKHHRERGKIRKLYKVPYWIVHN